MWQRENIPEPLNAEDAYQLLRQIIRGEDDESRHLYEGFKHIITTIQLVMDPAVQVPEADRPNEVEMLLARLWRIPDWCLAKEAQVKGEEFKAKAITVPSLAILPAYAIERWILYSWTNTIQSFKGLVENSKGAISIRHIQGFLVFSTRKPLRMKKGNENEIQGTLARTEWTVAAIKLMACPGLCKALLEAMDKPMIDAEPVVKPYDEPVINISPAKLALWFARNGLSFQEMDDAAAFAQQFIYEQCREPANKEKWIEIARFVLHWANAKNAMAPGIDDEYRQPDAYFRKYQFRPEQHKQKLIEQNQCYKVTFDRIDKILPYDPKRPGSKVEVGDPPANIDEFYSNDDVATIRAGEGNEQAQTQAASQAENEQAQAEGDTS
jgi:hypothetical protein